ncbi:hypothetical protein [Shewanella sedimentimangrovi]|uniref:DUF3325 domain-containing protein n=1 Tax=Shewanella sedimentimangrovi TaxID=2814293 RepID=A0ABX7R2D0_9GAMM|nr:hypothetical protein [Shewanella sedimentimangrovi]QSX37013.1 hypothetical protein JYB85_17410 [Shewanella sedimentimangrovi]
MEFIFYLAALLLISLAFAHSYLGERYILCRLFKRDNLPKLFGSDDFTKRTLRFAWHLTSVAWLGMSAIVAVMAQPELNKSLLGQIIALTFAAHFLVALLGSKGKHLSWMVFGAVSLLVVWGST